MAETREANSSGAASIHSMAGSLRKKVIWRLAYRRVWSFIFSAMAASPAPEDMAGAFAIAEAGSSATKIPGNR